MGSLARDLRFAVRLLITRPGWTIAAILCLAIATGANTAAFSAVNALLLRPLPFDKPEELVMVALQDPSHQSARPFSLTEYRSVVEANDSGVTLLARTFSAVSIADADGSSVAQAEFVSGNYFHVLRVAPFAGRMFDGAADQSGVPPTAVISYAFWQKRFASNVSILGQSVRVNGRSIVVSAIAPPNFVGATRLVAADLWLPAAIYASVVGDPEAEGTPAFGVMGRMSGDLSIRSAQSRLDTIVARTGRKRGASTPPRAIVDPAVGFGVPNAVRRKVVEGAALIFVLMGMVIAVACANVAALVLALASARQREIGLRVAMGATHWRVATQLMTESLVLATAGASCGWFVANWVTRIVAAGSHTPFEHVSYAVDIRPDLRVLAYAMGAALFTTVVVGFTPIKQALQIDLVSVLKTTTSSHRRSSLRAFSALVISQIAASTLLLAGSAALVRSYVNANSPDAHIDILRTLVVTVDMNQVADNSDLRRQMLDDLVTRVSTIRGVSAAGLTRRIPLMPIASSVSIWADDDGLARSQQTAQSEIVDKNYFRMLGIRVVQGSAFQTTEPKRPLVALINEAMAYRFSRGSSIIGRTFRRDDAHTEPIEIIGIVRDMRDEAVFYQPFSQVAPSQMSLLVNAPYNPVLVRAIQQEIQTMSSDLALPTVRTLAEQLALVTSGRRQIATSLSAVSVVGLLLANLGLYGVISYGVSQRRREFGIRMTLGASSRDIRAMVLIHGLRLTLVGLLIGVSLSFALIRILQGILPGISGTDPMLLVGISVVLVVVSSVALYLPARRATMVDPRVTLRAE